VPSATSCPQLAVSCEVGDWSTFSPQKHTCDTPPCSREGAPCWDGLQELVGAAFTLKFCW